MNQDRGPTVNRRSATGEDRIAELHEREARYRALFEHTNDAIFILDLHGTHLMVNHQAANLLGYTEDELVGMSMEQTIPPLEYADSQKRLASLLDGRQLPVYEQVLRRKDGVKVPVEINVALVRDAEGNPLHIQSIVRDITERKKIEEALTRERDLLHALFDNIPDGIYFKDTDSRFTRINRAQAQVLGLSDPAEAVGKTDFDFFLKDHAQDAHADEQKIIQTRQPVIDKLEKIRGADGRSRWLSTTKAPILDQEQQVVGLVGITRDITERRQDREALQESEQRFRSIFENAAMGLYRTTPDGQILMANPALLRILGYAVFDELAQRSLEENGYASDYPRSAFKERIERDGQVVGLESTWTKLDGSKVCIRENVRAVRDQDGQIRYYEGAVEDITEQKQAEEALRRSEERYRILFKYNPSMYFTIDPDGALLSVNDYGAEQLGYASEELVGHSILELFHPDDRKPVQQHVTTCLQMPGKVVQWEFRKIRKDGAVLWVKEAARAVRDADDRWVVLVVCEDITERRDAEAERERLLADLMLRSNQLLTAAEVSKSASTILDPEDLIDQVVNVIQMRFGFYYVGLFLTDDAGEYAVLQAGTGEAGQQMLDEGHKLAVGGDSMIGQCVATAKARIALDVGQEAVRFDNPVLPETRSEMALPLISRGQCIGALTVQSTQEAAFGAGDITSLQAMADQLAIAISNARLYDEVQRYAAQLEDRVAERTAELGAVNKELEAFAYSVSHDLRAPLRSIDGFSQALLEDYDGELDAIGQDYLQRVRAASQRMGRLIDDLLKLSRLTRRKMHREEVDLSAMARTITKELVQHEPERHVELAIAENIVADSDAHLLRIAMENLLGNAWKFTSRQPEALIEFGVMQDGNEEVYFVRDDGAGFDMTYIDKLFGAFQRLHTTTEFEGTGIGLATVQRIIHRHGGRIWAEGAVDQGATFYFTLALTGEEAK